MWSASNCRQRPSRPLAWLVAMTWVTCAAAETVPWTQQAKLQELVRDRRPHKPISVVVNLDLPPEDRWTSIIKEHRDSVQALVSYLDSFLPKWIQPVVFALMRQVIHYKGFGDTYRAEMEGMAKELDIDVALVVMGNLLYELEAIEVKCVQENTTGPCRNDRTYDAASDSSFPFKHLHGANQLPGPKGPCTSIVAQNTSGSMWHGRNLDWNLPPVLRQLMINVHYQRSGKDVFIGSGFLGYVGILTGMKPGKLSWSMNARFNGGNTLGNLVEALFHSSMPSAMKAREILETADTFDAAVASMKQARTVSPAYFIVAGPEEGQGAVITRDRGGTADTWQVNKSKAGGWFRLQTNYDHWEPAPADDDRRTPGNRLMQEVGPSKLSDDTLTQVLKTWPVFNPHTDFTAIMNPKSGIYQTMWWDDGNSSSWMGSSHRSPIVV